MPLFGKIHNSDQKKLSKGDDNEECPLKKNGQNGNGNFPRSVCTKEADTSSAKNNNSGGAQQKKRSEKSQFRSPTPPPPCDSVKTIKAGNPMAPMPQSTGDGSDLMFYCQLAHGSPSGMISGFSNLRELYERVAECYAIPFDDILFCTLNTHQVDLERLLGGQIVLEDFIFVHVRGQKKEVEIIKNASVLGITITDNGAGKAIVKRIKPDSVVGRLSTVVKPGDHIEKINDDNMVGKKHYEVANYLRDLPLNSAFTLRLIEPLQAAFVKPNSGSGMSRKGYGSNISRMKTLRFKARGVAVPVLTDTRIDAAIIDRVNAILESYLGINDAELALCIADLSKEPGAATNPSGFVNALRRSELNEFQIPDEVAFDLWAAVKDLREGRVALYNVPDDKDATITRATFSDKPVAVVNGVQRDESLSK